MISMLNSSRPDPGVSRLTGLRPLPPTPKREVLRITIERGLRRFITLALRRTLKPRSLMSATEGAPVPPPRPSTWDLSGHAAPAVVRLALSPTTLSFSRLEPLLPSLPPRRTLGVGGFCWVNEFERAAPSAADPEKKHVAFEFEL